MKKFLPYILIGLAIIAAVFLFFRGKSDKERFLNERISFRKKDKIPYGMKAAFDGLHSVFPRAVISTNRQMPGYWDSLSEYKRDQALIIVVPDFRPDDYEMKNLIRFIENGNNVFISAMNINDEASKILACDINSSSMLFYYYDNDAADTLTVFLNNPPFANKPSYTYPGKRLDSYFSKTDSTLTTILGYDNMMRPNFIHLKAGAGNLFVHLAPMSLTNYFLLHKNNFAYYENLFSLMPSRITQVVWDEYYLAKRDNPQKKSNWLSVFFRYPALKWALITALLTLIVFILMEMRRKQRPIPVINKPKNDSLDFVKTIGRLYHDKGDHKNLSKKMAAYFLEHVRSRYKLPTNHLNDEFIKQLTFKTAIDENEIRKIVDFINEIDAHDFINDHQLTVFHKQLESFYKQA